MDDRRFGAILRAVRFRRGLRQVDVAVAARVSHQTVSRVERGYAATLKMDTLRAVAKALDIRVELAPWSRGGDLHRLATANHAALVESLLRELARHRWDARAEASFSSYGERGFIDVLAWHPPSKTLLVVEAKTEIVDVGETIGLLDRKRRLAPAIGRDLGWPPGTVSWALIVRDTRTNRRRVAEHQVSFRSLLPADGAAFRAHLRAPSGSLGAMAFWSDSRGQDVSQRSAAAGRVRRRATSRDKCR